MIVCADGKHAVRVVDYLLGQYRIQITDLEQPDMDEYGRIVREVCTYSPQRAAHTVFDLEASTDPLGLAESWAKPWNCEYSGGRIRLDNTPDERPS